MDDIWIKHRILKRLVESMSWNETSQHHGHSLLRSEILSEAIALSMPKTVNKALEYFSIIKSVTLGQPLSDSNIIIEFTDRDLARGQVASGLTTDLLNVVWDAGVIHGKYERFKLKNSH